MQERWTRVRINSVFLQNALPIRVELERAAESIKKKKEGGGRESASG